MLNLPEKTAKRDIIHGVKHLEEIAEDWLCARRTLSILSVLARKWNVTLPEEASIVLQKTDEKYGTFSTSDVPSPSVTTPSNISSPPPSFSRPTSTKQEQLSPLNQQTPPPPAPPRVTPEVPVTTISPDLTTMSTDMLNNLAMQITPANLQAMSQPAAMSIPDSISATNPWTMPTTTQQVPNYTQAFSPVQNSMSHLQTSQARNNRQVSPMPNQPFGVDGRDWYLKDGVNWHQNFEAWNLGGQNNYSNGSPSPSVTVDDLPDPTMFMFRGLSNGEIDTNLDSLSNSISGLDQLTGLE
jgi:hypothetical protein